LRNQLREQHGVSGQSRRFEADCVLVRYQGARVDLRQRLAHKSERLSQAVARLPVAVVAPQQRRELWARLSLAMVQRKIGQERAGFFGRQRNRISGVRLEPETAEQCKIDLGHLSQSGLPRQSVAAGFCLSHPDFGHDKTPQSSVFCSFITLGRTGRLRHCRSLLRERQPFAQGPLKPTEEVMRNFLSIVNATFLVLGGLHAEASELPAFEKLGFPITQTQVSTLGAAGVEESSHTPTLSLGGMPASPHQIAVLTPRPQSEKQVRPAEVTEANFTAR
jgi:hypothetical protein